MNNFSFILVKKWTDLTILCHTFPCSLSASDYYQLDDLLTPEEQATRRKVREAMEKEVAPIMAEVSVYQLIYIFSKVAITIVYHVLKTNKKYEDS